MNSQFKRLGTIFATFTLALTALAAAPAVTAPDLSAIFPGIRKQLADDNYATREAGQKELDKIPLAQMEALRALAVAETDPEVKARVERRIDAMEVYKLLHPATLSLNFKDASLATVVAEINKQLGANYISTTGVIDQGKYTLQAENQSFWEVFNQLNRQNTFTISSVSSTTSDNVFQLRPSAGASTNYRLVESFAFQPPQISGQPATGSWSLRFTGYADPRVRITQYAPLRIDKLIDQDNNNLQPQATSTVTSMSTLSRPAAAWTNSVTLQSIPGLRHIKELRASVTVTILEKEQVYSLDLTKDVGPIETTRGRFTVDKNANGDMTLRLTPPAAAPNPPVTSSSILRTNIRVLDQNGRVTTSSSFSGTSPSITYTIRVANAPAKVEISWPEKSREVVLPVEFTDIDVPAPAAGGGGVIIMPAGGRGVIQIDRGGGIIIEGGSGVIIKGGVINGGGGIIDTDRLIVEPVIRP